ncbi:unnamed protein product [Cochlearia groenlandica]
MASMASSPISFSSSFLKIKPVLPPSPLFFPLRTLHCSLSSSPEPIEFDISFAPLKPTLPSTRGESVAVQQLFIPNISPRRRIQPLPPPSPSPPHQLRFKDHNHNENFRETPRRLSKVLAAAGVASRRTSEDLIIDGKVIVNGSLCITPQTIVDPTRDIIYVKGNRVPKKLPPKVYFAMNKPKGLFSLMYSSHL